MRTISPWMGRLLQGLSWKKLFWILLGAAIATFGIHNIHQQAGITEGGVIGAMLLAGHWLGFSPSVITPVLDVACYLLAWRYLGGMFIKISVLSTASVSLFYRLWEQFPYMLPDLSLQGGKVPAVLCLPLHGFDRAGPLPQLYPPEPYFVLCGDSDPVLLPHRPGAEFLPPAAGKSLKPALQSRSARL